MQVRILYKSATHSPRRKFLAARRAAPRLYPVAALLAAWGLAAALPAAAFEVETDTPDLKIRWDNSFKYSTARRLKDPSAVLTGEVNQDDGDRNFDKGMISNRVDLLSELDIGYKNFGARVSGAAWYDDVYNKSNANNSPATANAFSTPYNQFTDAARKLHGHKAEFLDAYVFGKFDLDGRQSTVRLGKHTLIYGESLFFGGNGIAGAMAPVDAVKALSVPGSQVKEILMPVPQVSTQVQLTDEVSAGAYYQFRWEATRLPAVGSYFSPLDMGGPGAERLIAGPPLMPGGGPAALFHGADANAKNSGQGGAQLRYRPKGGDIEYGVYALQFHAKTPLVFANPGVGVNPATGQVGTYGFVYGENIKLYGLSASTSIGDAGVAGEVSVRRNTPLDSSGFTTPDGYTAGNSAHAQVSALYVLPKTRLWGSASIAAEVAWNRVTSITRNADKLDPLATRDGWGYRILFEPTYYQVLPALDLSVPINIGYAPKGRSALAANLGPNKGGDITIGLNGEYAKLWKFGLSYTHYFGTEATLLNPLTGYTNNYNQAMKDRDFVSFNVQRTF